MEILGKIFFFSVGIIGALLAWFYVVDWTFGKLGKYIKAYALFASYCYDYKKYKAWVNNNKYTDNINDTRISNTTGNGIIGLFVKQNITSDPDSRISISDLYSAYCNFCINNGVSTESRTAFAEKINTILPESKYIVVGGKRFIVGFDFARI